LNKKKPTAISFQRAGRKKIYSLFIEVFAKVTFAVIPAKAGIQNHLKILDSGSRFACPE